MTFADFRTLTLAYLEYQAQDYTEGNAGERNASIARSLQEFTEMTGVIYRFDVTINFGIGTYRHNFRDSLLSFVTVARVNNELLRDVDGTASPMSAERFSYLDRSETGPPEHYCLPDASTIAIWPKPDVAVDVVVDGIGIHAGYTADGTAIEIPLAYQRLAAIFCAVALMEPRAEGSLFERMNALSAGAGGLMQELIGKVSTGLTGSREINHDEKRAV